MSNIDVRVAGETEQFANPGAQLGQLREQRGFTVEDVAEKLRLRPTLLADIENDNYSQLPHSVFVKGYLRAYAKLLGVDPKPFISSYELTFNAEDPKIERMFRQNQRHYSVQDKKIRWLSSAVMLFLVAFTAIWWQKDFLLDKAALAVQTTTSIASSAAKKSEPATDPKELTENTTQAAVMNSVLTEPDAQDILEGP
jgi:cytoskeleton protein RodZ